jgi:hypothetical protein
MEARRHTLLYSSMAKGGNGFSILDRHSNSEKGSCSRSTEKPWGMTNTLEENYYTTGSWIFSTCIVVGNNSYDVLRQYK